MSRCAAKSVRKLEAVKVGRLHPKIFNLRLTNSFSVSIFAKQALRATGSSDSSVIREVLKSKVPMAKDSKNYEN